MIKQKLPIKLRKRDGSLIAFDKIMIVNAIYKASLEVISDHEKARQIADNLSNIVIKVISE